MKKNNQFKLLMELFFTFFKIGSFTFGGGYAMIPLIEREVVEKKRWVSEEEVVDVFAVAQSMPGAIAINSSTFIGYKIAGKRGAVVATLGVVLPSFFIIALIAIFYSQFQDAAAVKAVFSGIRPAIVSLIAVAAIRISKTSIVDWTGLILAILSSFSVVFFDVHAAFAILGGATAGLAIFIMFPKKTEKILSNGGNKN